MTVLDRAEAAYLGILRVVILLVATLAIVVAVFGLIIGGKMFFDSKSTASKAPPVQAVTLGDWVSEKKAAAPGTTGDSADSSSGGESISAPRQISDAAQYLVDYAHRTGTGPNAVSLSKMQLVKVLLNKQNEIPEQYRASYRESLKGLCYQLTISRGRPLNIDQLNELLDWHLTKFKGGATEDQTAKLLKGAAGSATLGIAGGAMLTFLLLVFCFLFVKIERNLRTLRVVEVPAP